MSGRIDERAENRSAANNVSVDASPKNRGENRYYVARKHPSATCTCAWETTRCVKSRPRRRRAIMSITPATAKRWERLAGLSRETRWKTRANRRRRRGVALFRRYRILVPANGVSSDIISSYTAIKYTVSARWTTSSPAKQPARYIV